MRTVCLFLLPLFLMFFSVNAEEDEDEIFKFTPERPSVEMPFFIIPFVFSWDIPNKAMMPNMDVNFGFGFGLTFFSQNSNLGFEFKGFSGEYSKLEETRLFSFYNNNAQSTYLRLRYRSKMNKYLFGVRWINVESKSVIKPYLTPQIGIASFRSRIHIPDPDDIDDCLPLENRVIHRNSGMVYGGEAGLEINLSRHRKKTDYKGIGTFFQFSVGVLRGVTEFEYINARHIKDPNPNPVSDNHTHLHRQTHLTAPFINITSNEVHHHQIAEIYRTPLRFTTINFGLVHKF